MVSKKKTRIRIFLDDLLNPCDFSSYFSNPEWPLEVDIGSGKGRFLIARSGNFPKVNFLGIERQLVRVNRSGRKCERVGRKNVRLLRMEGYYSIRWLMPKNSIDTYYFFFPDPWPKDRHANNRLFSKDFMYALHESLKTGGLIHIATDHLPYFNDIYHLLILDKRFKEIEPFIPIDEEKTDFEIIFKDKEIRRCSFCKL